MNRKIATILGLYLYWSIGAAQAAVIDLVDWGFNIDNTIYWSPAVYSPPDPNQLPPNVDYSGFDFSTGGLGNISVDIAGAGNHYIGAFFDHEIDEPINSFFNETASVSGASTAGQSWEVDEPGWGSLPNAPYQGDIYDNVLDSTLDNQLFYDSIFNESLILDYGTDSDDVAMAMAWDFTLGADQMATIDFFLDTILPVTSPSFYLSHSDPDSLNPLTGNPETIYFWTSLSISTIPTTVPEPGTLLLMGVGLLVLVRAKVKVGDHKKVGGGFYKYASSEISMGHFRFW